MPLQVTNEASIVCSFGSEPSELTVVPQVRLAAEGRLTATVMDCVPLENILPFGECSSLANPEVAAATVAEGGELTPQPCVPVVIGPWEPGEPRVRINGQPALIEGSVCRCAWLGVISIETPGTLHTEFK